MITPLYLGSGKRFVGVLAPREKNLIWEYLNADYKIRFDFLLYSYVRIAEGYHFLTHPDYYRKDNHHIFFPNVEEIGKKRCTIKNRAVALSSKGMDAVDLFIQKRVGLTAYQNMEAALKRAAFDADFDLKYITTKMLRKTYISWLMATMPEKQMQISFSAGHDYSTMRKHYLTFGWKKTDIEDMRDEVKGWGE